MRKQVRSTARTKITASREMRIAVEGLSLSF
jgi:hypothetical protein